MKIAVIGSGVSGLGAAWALSRVHEVTVFEADSRLGGHSNTLSVTEGGRQIPVDTGFIVFNERNYPNLVQLLRTLGVATEASDMSFSVSIDRGAFEYRARLLGLLAQPTNLLRPSYLRMCAEIVRFTREAKQVATSGSTMTTGEFLDRGGYSRAFRDDFLLPMVACIWSSRLAQMLAYPAATMAGFLDNHGLLDLHDRPQWRTVSGGSRSYVRRIEDGLTDVRTSAPVHAVERSREGVTVRFGAREERYDHVVLATHADTTLRILGTHATDEERRVLGAFGYQENRAVLHRDPSLMPVRPRAWSSWNYLASSRPGDEAERRVSLTYWMNRLQNLDTERPVLVTLNPIREPRDVVAETTYHHPQFDGAAIDAQRRIPELQGVDRCWFAGSYTGYGFHEDGLRSGLQVAAALGAPAPWWTDEDGGRTRRHREPIAAGR